MIGLARRASSYLRDQPLLLLGSSVVNDFLLTTRADPNAEQKAKQSPENKKDAKGGGLTD